MSIAIVNSQEGLKNITFNQLIAAITEDKKTRVSVDTLFHEQGWFSACVKHRARSLQGIPWAVKRGESIVWDSEQGSVPDELAVIEDLPRFLFLWEASLVVSGRAYTLKLSEGRGISALMYLNPFNVKPVKTPDAGIVGYTRQVNTTIETYEAEDVIAMFEPDPFYENGHGPGTGYSAKQNAQVLRALDGFLNNFVDKGLIKATILSVEGGEHIQPDMLEKLRMFWNKTLAGWRNGGTQHVFNSKVNVDQIGEGIGDLSDSILIEDQRKAIANAFGIPIGLLDSTVANVKQESDQLEYLTKTVIPQARMLQREVNNQLFRGLGLTFEFEPRKLEVLQQHELTKAVSLVSLTGGKPILRVWEARELLGYAPDPFLDEGGASSSATEVVIDQREPEPRRLVQATDEDTEGKAIEIQLSTRQAGIEADLVAWRRKVKAKGRQVKFSPDFLTDYESAIIRQRLEAGEALFDAFSPPFVGF